MSTLTMLSALEVRTAYTALYKLSIYITLHFSPKNCYAVTRDTGN